MDMIDSIEQRNYPNNIDEKRFQIIFVAHHSMNIKKVIYEAFFLQVMMLENWIESVV